MEKKNAIPKNARSFFLCCRKKKMFMAVICTDVQCANKKKNRAMCNLCAQKATKKKQH